MKVVESLAYFLIVGILSSTNTQGYAQLTCTNNNGPKAYALVLQNSAKNFQQCIVFVQFELIQEARKHPDGKMDAVFALYCEKVETIKSCFKQFVDSIKSCLPSDKHESMDMVYNIGASLMQYACDKAKLLEKGFKKNCTGECLTTKRQGVTNCAKKFTNGRHAGTLDFSGAENNFLEAVPDLKLSSDEQGCRELENFQQCSINAVKDRNDSIYSEILDSMYKYINNDIPCKNLPRSPKSNASVTGVANVLLSLIATMAIFL